MTKITVHGALIRAILRALMLRTDAPLGEHLRAALETLNEEIDQWAISSDGLKVLVDNDNPRKLTVSDTLVRASMLVAARRFEAPLGTALRNSLDRVAVELDSWAVTGSLDKRQRRDSSVTLKKRSN